MLIARFTIEFHADVHGDSDDPDGLASRLADALDHAYPDDKLTETAVQVAKAAVEHGGYHPDTFAVKVRDN